MWFLILTAIVLERQRPSVAVYVRRRQLAAETQEAQALPQYIGMGDTSQATQVTSAWQLPVRPGEPDQLVIHIEPDDTPTPEQRTVRRIIDYLQEMPQHPTD